MTIEINNSLDLKALAKDFQRKGRLQIPNFLTSESAERVFNSLNSTTPWRIVFFNGQKAVQLSSAELNAATREQQDNLERGILARARNEYQFIYYTYPIVETYLAGQDQGHLLHRFLEFVNSGPTLDLMRTITGIPELMRADGHATFYNPGHFLTEHTDQDTTQGWRIAYSLNLTKGWMPDWGGYLQFYDEDKNIEQAFMPAFNVLNIFAVPQTHAVSYVAPFAGAPRYAITGWFMDKAPAKPD
ncbi:MAG: 2OG-Fe(II) oxygenase [Sphingomonadales bacterium]